MGEQTTKVEPPGTLLLGKLIGPYRITNVLGEGGMGIVYEAVHASLGQHVAIKVLRHNFASDSKALQRFFNEARAVSIVQHPGLVRIHDYQQTSDGTAYIVMELLQGQSLDLRMSTTADTGAGLALTKTLQLIHQVASALAAAHAAGVVHCDLKPENILLARDSDVDGGERAKVLDFGIAKFLAESTGKQTTVGLILGTPKYMAPEQCEGRDNLTDKADVYSLGVILYECLTGSPPFVAQSATALMRQHMVMDPPLLRERVRSLPVGLHELVHLMLAKEPAARPAMAQVATRLQLLKEETRQVGGRGGRRRSPLLLIGGALGLWAVLGAGSLVAKLRQPQKSQPTSAIAVGTPVGRSASPPTTALALPESPPGGHPRTADAPVKSPEALLKAEGPRRHKASRPTPKESPLVAEPSSPGVVAAVPAAEPQPPKPPPRAKITNGDIEPDR